MPYTIAVRALCEFTAKQGDLDLRFTPAPTAQEGIAGHQRVVARRGADYEPELTLTAEFGELQVRGRADGYDPVANRLEEIKTFRGDLSRMPANHRALHWAQARVYGAMLCRARGLSSIELALVYFDIGSEREHCIVEPWSAADLDRFFITQCERFLAWAQQELQHYQYRNGALVDLAFPLDGFRQGQRDLAEAVYKTAATGRCLLAQAPTGIGKTIGTLFPLLKATSPRQLDRIFFLTAKTPGRQLALDALAQLRSGGAKPLRVLELIARDKACEHPDKACHGDACPLAQGFYDRLPAARAAAVATEVLTQQTLQSVARTHQVCPYWLGQEMARWCDVVVGDYNHFFDLSALLHGLTQTHGWRVALLVDEAHNLVDRARGMYSAALESGAVARAQRVAPPALKKSLTRLRRQWRTLAGDDEVQPLQRGTSAPGYSVLPGPPTSLLTALQSFTSAATEWLSDQPTALEPALQQLYFDALHFCQIAERFGEHYLCDLELLGTGPQHSLYGAAEADDKRRHGEMRLTLRNVVPAPELAERFGSAHSSVLFSATLQPTNYFRDLLGLPERTLTVEIASPFAPSQLQVAVKSVSTRFRDRSRSLDPITSLVVAQYRARPGNYLLFASSFAYLEAIAGQLADHADIPYWLQTRNMGEADRSAFLARFTEESSGVGLAVLGGAFGEGVDLPGKRLVGAFVATLGLPQLNPVNEQLRLRLEALLGDGYRYTYLYPGLQKVVQAAGRIIRTERDSGVLHLIDDRFAQREIRALLPSWWQIDAVSQPFSGATDTAISSSSMAIATTMG